MVENSDIIRARHQRLRETLKRLLQQGMSQHEIAQRAEVPPQYLSDVKAGRKAVTELFARRLAERLGVDYQWLMQGRCVRVAPADRHAPGAGAVGGILVPVLDGPCLGAPQESTAWDGSVVELAGPAAVAARGAKNPYVLRLSTGSRAMQIPLGALLLASQGVDPSRKVAVLRTGDTLCLAQRDERDPDSWREVRAGKRLGGSVKVVGCILGVIWAAV